MSPPARAQVSFIPARNPGRHTSSPARRPQPRGIFGPQEIRSPDLHARILAGREGSQQHRGRAWSPRSWSATNPSSARPEDLEESAREQHSTAVSTSLNHSALLLSRNHTLVSVLGSVRRPMESPRGVGDCGSEMRFPGILYELPEHQGELGAGVAGGGATTPD
ncbi:unnamed protein product [Diplocarpon coronariae]